MTGIVLEGMSLDTFYDITDWLTDTCGPPSEDTWYIFHDYDLKDLMFTREIGTMLYLRWGHVL